MGRRHITPDWDGPDTGFEFTRVFAFIDTLECLFRLPIPDGFEERLLESFEGDFVGTPQRRLDGLPPMYLHMRFQQPTRQTLELLASIDPSNVTICRCDIAVDAECATDREALNAGRFFRRHALQKWRGGREFNVHENTAYWSRNRRTPRTIAQYSDRPSKAGFAHCPHFELRFMTASACRRAGGSMGLNDPKILKGDIDIIALLEHETRLARIDPRTFNLIGERAARRTKYRRYRHNDDRTVRHLHRRMNGIRFAALQTEDFTPDEGTISRVDAQEFYDRARGMRACLKPLTRWRDVIPKPLWLMSEDTWSYTKLL